MDLNPLHAIGNLWKDYQGVGQIKGGNYQAYDPGNVQYGGYDGGARDVASMGFGQANNDWRNGNYAAGQMQDPRAAQSVENQTLANREAFSRGYDQSGALQLARQAAMGNAPSEAAYQLQAGLDRSLAQQQAMAGSARGNAGIALAGANMGANMTALQNQAFTQAGQLRAQEMAAARQQYGDLANTMRAQDQNRLQMADQNSQFNANLNDQYRMGMGNLGIGYGNAGTGAYSAGQNPYNSQMQGDMNTQNNATSSANQAQGLSAGKSAFNADAKQRANDRLWGFVGGMGGSAGGILSSFLNKGGGGGGTPPPTGG